MKYLMTFLGDPFTLTQLFSFIKKYSKVHVLAPGCDEKLDILGQKFVVEEGKRKDILKQTESFIEEEECDEVCWS